MKEKNIQELAKRMGLITVENMCQYTITQLVVMVANKVNELINEVGRFETDVQEILKTQNENIQYLLGEGLHLEVENIFDGWLQDGTFDTLLNQSALKKVNDRIDETNAHLTDITTINVMDYGLKGDGTSENLTQLKALLANKLTNKTILFPANKTFKINEPITLMTEKCCIKIEGVIVADNCDALLLQDVVDCEITINTIKTPKEYNVWYDYNNGKNIINYLEFNYYGVRFNNARTNKITINNIHGFKYGLYFAPSSYLLNGVYIESGAQYNEVTFNQLEACTYPICFERLYTNSWANSNFIRGGMTSGYTAIKFVNSSFKGDPYNQNVFTNIGCEYLKNGGFLLEEGKENVFYDFRHDKVDEFYIKTSSKCRHNTFKTNYSGYLQGCAIEGENNVIDMPNYKYSDSLSLISNKSTYLKGSQTRYNECNYYKGEITDRISECKCVDGDLPMNGYFKVIKDYNNKARLITPFSHFTTVSSGTFTVNYKNMHHVFYLNTKSSNVTIKFDETAQNIDYGFEYTFMTTGNFSNIPVFVDKDGNEISSLKNKITETDVLYKIIYIGGEYACFKVGSRV